MENEGSFLQAAIMRLKNLRVSLCQSTPGIVLRQEARIAILRHTFRYPEDGKLEPQLTALHMKGAG